MAVTIYDVAKAAGVGIGTVSRVLNNSTLVKEATRKKVLQVIEAMDYHPDPIARSMTSGYTGAVGIIVPFFTRPFFTELLRGVEGEIARLNRELVLYNVETNSVRDYYFKKLPMRRKVDGLLVISLSPGDEAAQNFIEAEIPVVLVDAYSPLLTSLVVNNMEGAYRAVKYLIELGHRRIGFINGEIEGDFKFNQANDRLIGLHRAFGEAGVEFDPRLVVTAEWNRHDGRRAAFELLKRKNRPTAIFAASDVQAIGVLEAARSTGIRIPEELSVIGYDGIEMSELLDLSTVEQPMAELGEAGVNKLMELMQEPPVEPELIRFDTRLVIRRTTAPPPGTS